MEMNPQMLPGEKQVYPGGLDAASSNKVAAHIRNVGSLGLPLIFNASITGFMPRHTDHLEGVVPGGARILDALREFNQAAIMWVPPQGFLYGGAWVVIDKNINPNISMVADETAQMGILGSAAANDLPMVARTRKSPDEYNLTREMIDAINTPRRAFEVGSIHGLIEDTAKTRTELHRILTEKRDEVAQRKAAAAAHGQLMREIQGALGLMGANYEIQGDQIQITTEAGTFTTSLDNARAGLRSFFKGNVLEGIRAMVAPPKKADE